MAARNIQLTAAEFAPRGLDTATSAERFAFWRRLGEVAVRVKKREIVRGIGPDGKKFEPVRRPRPDGATRAPLAPHGAESRTSRLLAAHVTDHGCTLFWRGHGRKSWTTILGYHADGVVHGAYLRDEIGITRAGRRAIKSEMAGWWKLRVANAGRREGRKAERAKPQSPAVERPRAGRRIAARPGQAEPRADTPSP